MTNEQRQALIDAAIRARRLAYAPYSNFLVGAALLAADGDIFTGCNVENASYGLTICAERTAFCSAVAAGRREFQALALATTGGVPPCGACRQFAKEFCDDLLILLIDAEQPDRLEETTLSRLFPSGFSLPPSTSPSSESREFQ